MQTYGFVESRSGEKTMTQQRLSSMDGDLKNRSYINNGASINNSYFKELLTKIMKPDMTLKIQNSGEPIHKLQIRSQQHLMIPNSTFEFTIFDYFKDVIVEASEDLKNSCSHYSGNNQLFKIDVDSPSLPLKDTELFYHHIARLLFTSKIA